MNAFSRTVLLAAGLSLLPASAQAQSAAPPIPAAPASAVPASQDDSAERLTLNPAPGTALEYATSTQVQFTAFELTAAAQPGAALSAAQQSQLAALKRDLSAQLPALKAALGRSVQAITSKQFISVLPRDTEGNTVLLTSMVTAPTSVTDASGTVTTTPAQTVRLTQTLAPDGQVLSAKVQTDDPALQQVYDAMQMDDLLASFSQTGGTTLYGINLKVGETHTSTQNLDLSGLLGGLGSLLGGSDISADLKAQPLALSVATTYLGTNASGVRSYQQRYAAAPWTLDLSVAGPAGQSTSMTLSVSAWSGQGGLSYRADGLPQTSDNTQALAVDMSVNLPDLPAQLQAHLGMTLTISSAVR